jgi:hypothetical protein
MGSNQESIEQKMQHARKTGKAQYFNRRIRVNKHLGDAHKVAEMMILTLPLV